MIVREAGAGDLDAILDVQRRAFGGEIEPALVRDMLADESAQPRLSLLAFEGDARIGHILFSAATLNGEKTPKASILAPLAVLPSAQGRGVGSALVEQGLTRLADAGRALVFVLGDPAFYSRFGFEPAGPRGLAAPCPIAAEHADAWQVLALDDGAGVHAGQVQCCDSLNRPELWAG